MATFRLNKDKLEQFIKIISKEYALFGPVESDGTTSFKEITPNSQLLILDSYNTDKPPKEVFFPQTETMFAYNEKGIHSSVYKGKPIALFGVRPCDAKSFLLLNKVFKENEYEDPYWIGRYKNALIFVLACNNPLSTCFCNWLNGGPFNKKGADIFLIDINDAFLIEPCSQKGEEFITNLSSSIRLPKAVRSDLKRAESIKEEAESLLSESIELASLKEALDHLWDNPVWEEIAYKCLNCAVCSYLCPTCHCFDIQDENRERIRIWDSCMFSLFTKEASGYNPRPTGKERMRQRIMHKFSYLVDNLGEFACVGCGRCIRDCPVNMDIREIISKIINVRLALGTNI